MKKCPYCGEELEDNSSFCIYCMTSLDEKKRISPLTIKRKIPLIIVTSIAITVIAVIVVLLISSAGDDTPIPDNKIDSGLIANPTVTSNNIANIIGTMTTKPNNTSQATEPQKTPQETTYPIETSKPEATHKQETIITNPPVQTEKPYNPTPAVTNLPDTNSIISIGKATAHRGETVTLNLDISNNPGLVTMSVKIVYDTEKLELIEVKDSGLLKGTMLNTKYTSPYIITWVDGETKTDNTQNGTIAALKFKIKDTSESGTSNISLYYLESYNTNYELNAFNYHSGSIDII